MPAIATPFMHNKWSFLTNYSSSSNISNSQYSIDVGEIFLWPMNLVSEKKKMSVKDQGSPAQSLEHLKAFAVCMLTTTKYIGGILG